jgi:two-component system cell cycle response regulator CtrA
MRILAVDNEEAYLQAIEVMLGAEKFNVYGIDSAAEAIDLGKIYDYDIIVLSLPDQVDVIRALRAAKVKTPILVISRNGEVDVMVRALDAGADDYMTKPYQKDELVARINAIVRRSKGHAQSRIQIGDLVVNLDTKRISYGDQRVELTGKEYAMLELFALRKGCVQSKEQVLNHLYGGMDEPELKIIDVFVCKLRKKLALAGAPPDMVETVWGRGYLLRDGADREGKVTYSDIQAAAGAADAGGNATMSGGQVARRHAGAA